jgi:SdrD B-like protein
MRYLRLGKRAVGGLLGIAVLVMVAVFVVLPSLATATTPNWQPPASGTWKITPELVANGGQNNDCSFFYPGSTVNPDGTVTIPGGQVLHQFYINNPKNTNSATDPTTGATFNVSVNTKTNIVTSFGSSGAAIVDVGIKGGVNTTHYNYSGFIPQPDPLFVFPGTVTSDTTLHPPISGTDKQGNTTYYTVSHMSFCYTTGSTASGTVFTDANHNGSNDSGDAPLATTVNLYKGGSFVESTTSSSSTGAFQFTDLTPGTTTYKVCVVKPSSTVETLPSSSTAHNVSCSGTGEASLGYSVDSSTTVTGLDFGLAQVASISGVAFSDTNGDGVDGSGSNFGEPGLNGLTVSVTDTTTGGSAVTATTANDGTHDGVYSFSNLFVGDTYKVCITKPSGGYQQTAPGSGVSCTGTNVAPNGYSRALSSSNGSGTNFGFQPLGTLSGVVYKDVNGPLLAGPDGAFESGTDTPLSGWTVKLYNGSGTQVGQSATTDVNGGYSISTIFDPTQTYTACVTPVGTGTWAQTEPQPTAANSCATLSGLPKGQQFQPTTANAGVTKNFGVDPSVSEPTPCPPQTPFGGDQTGGELQIQLATCKPFQTFVFDTGTIDGAPWASVFAADQVVTPQNPEVPLIQKWVFTDPLNADGTPKYTHVDYTDVFPYNPNDAKQLPMCKLDPRDPSDPNGMTLSSNLNGVDYTQDANKTAVLPSSDTSCAISTRIYVDAQGVTRIEVYSYSDIDSWGKLG